MIVVYMGMALHVGMEVLPTTIGGYPITIGKQGIVWGGPIFHCHLLEGSHHFFFLGSEFFYG